MKWVGLLMILAGCSGLGLSYAGEYNKRLKALGELEQMLGFMKDAIEAHQVPLTEAIRMALEHMKGAHQTFLKEVLIQLEQFSGEDIAVIWRGKAELLKQDLSRQDYELFSHCMDQTGFLDATAQKKALDKSRQAFFEQIRKLTEKRDETCKLYKTIGVLAGIFFCVLLI